MLTKQELKNTGDTDQLFKLTIDDPSLKFSAAHFLVWHEKCSRLHGHNYHVKVEILGPLNTDKMVIDFGFIKELIKFELKKLDHYTIIPKNSPDLIVKKLYDTFSIINKITQRRYLLPINDVVLLPIESSTVECLAQYLYSRLTRSLNFWKYNITIYENEGSAATFGDF